MPSTSAAAASSTSLRVMGGRTGVSAWRTRRLRVSSSSGAAGTTGMRREESVDAIARRKEELVAVVEATKRGAFADLNKRAEIEEAQTRLESVGGDAIDVRGGLQGKWKLLYTTSFDLLPLFWVDNLSQANQIGSIFQEFDEPDATGKGKVKNIILGGLPPFLEEVTLTVSARYEVLSDRRITLSFEEAQVDSAVLTDLGKTIVSPAVLPRGQLNMRILQLIQDFSVAVPLGTPLETSAREAVGNPTLLLTFLDETLLIGRALPGGGVYILEKEQE